jgi:hypothetical protein
MNMKKRKRKENQKKNLKIKRLTSRHENHFYRRLLVFYLNLIIYGA